uniref:Uncharacterized protein n=1 Tax=Monodon monoceros TaxID=40151 RepID=A0A8C6C4Y1_MONMO
MAELVQGQSAPVGMKAEGFVDALHRVQQIAAKIDSIPHLNNSTPLVDPSVYGYGVQKQPLDDGVGNQLGALLHQRNFSKNRENQLLKIADNFCFVIFVCYFKCVSSGILFGAIPANSGTRMCCRAVTFQHGVFLFCFVCMSFYLQFFLLQQKVAWKS